MRIFDMPGGGPAFPHHITMDGEQVFFPGMTLRDYFIAHAPKEPPAWFKPVVALPTPPAQLQDLTEQERKDFISWECDGLHATAASTPRMREYLRQLGDFRAKQWERLVNREAFLQWPAWWADEQLKRVRQWRDQEERHGR